MDKDRNTVCLSDFSGKKIVLYFYPRDNTPGCTQQACAFAASYGQFRAQDVVVIGVSKDSVASHQKFAQKYDLSFLLLSDPELQSIQAYGVWQEKKLYGKEYSICMSKYLPDSVRFITCVFGEEKGGKVIEKGTMCKMARGEMVRYMAEQQIVNPEQIKSFNRLYYRFDETRSDDSTYIFLSEHGGRIEKSAKRQFLRYRLMPIRIL